MSKFLWGLTVFAVLGGALLWVINKQEPETEDPFEDEKNLFS